MASSENENVSVRPSAPRVVVTGGAGFIGAHVVGELLVRGVLVQVVDDLSAGSLSRLSRSSRCRVLVGDARDRAVLREALRAFDGADAVVHLAGCVGVRRVLAAPAEAFERNVALAAALAGVVGALDARSRPRVFAASTSEVYARKSGPLNERDPVVGAGTLGRAAYAASKLEGERVLDAALAGDARTAPVHLRFFNVVGPGQDASSGMVVPRFVERARAGLPLEIHGDGSHVRTFAHVAEVARTIADLVLARDVPAGPLNVGGRAVASVLELALALERAAGRPLARVFVDPRERVAASFEEVDRREVDLARLTSLDVHVPSMPLDAIVTSAWREHSNPSEESHPCASLAS